MTATYTQAIDDMFALFNAAWQNSNAIVGSVPEVRWQGVEERDVPPANAYWCRVSTQNVIDRQATLKSGVDSGQQRRYTSQGLLFVQLFCPMSDARAMEKGRQLAELARAAFRGVESPNGVWFRNARINELAPADNAYRFNIVVEYEYDDIA